MSEVRRILDSLHERYFSDPNHSVAASAHWRKYGQRQTMIPISSGYSLSGVGFGVFKKNNCINKFTNIPTVLYVDHMLRAASTKAKSAALRMVRSQSRLMTYDVARMVLTVDFLSEQLGDLNGKNFVIIGDGYGTLGCMLKLIYPSSDITYINLGKTLAFDLVYSAQVFPKERHHLISESEFQSSGFNYVSAEDVSSVTVTGDIFVNIASMQEMNPESIKIYFEIFRAQSIETFFYCCNRERKILPDGSVIRFEDYPWRDDDQVIVDELCPRHQIAPKNTPPFIVKFDGPTRHRLVRVAIDS